MSKQRTCKRGSLELLESKEDSKGQKLTTVASDPSKLPSELGASGVNEWRDKEGKNSHHRGHRERRGDAERWVAGRNDLGSGGVGGGGGTLGEGGVEPFGEAQG